MRTIILLLAISSTAFAQKAARIGAMLSPPPLGTGRGAVITSVLPDSPAAQGGLRVGDLLVGVGDTLVEGPYHAAERLALYKPGEAAPLTLLRAGRLTTVEVRLGSVEEEPRMRVGNDELRAQIALLEARVAELEKRLAELEKKKSK